MQPSTVWMPFRTWVMKQMRQSSCLRPIKSYVGQIARKSANQVFPAMAVVIGLAPRDEVLLHDQLQALWLLQQRSEVSRSALLAIMETRLLLQQNCVGAHSTSKRPRGDPIHSARKSPFSMLMLVRTTRLKSLACPWLSRRHPRNTRHLNFPNCRLTLKQLYSKR